MELNTLLTEMVEREGSDLHLVLGQPPVFRIDGALVWREGEAFEEEALNALLLSPLSEEQKTCLLAGRQDVEISLRREGRSYRYNLYRESGRLACAIRAVPQAPPSLEQLYPDASGIRSTLEALTELPRGLVLVTGPTGSGRNTTCAALLEMINRSKPRRILTLEDPIEFEMVSKRSLVTQRCIGQDVASFREGALSAFREDVDVVLISELRDLETIQYALALAESGHLVLSTLHLERATDAVRRIIEVFPEPRDLIRRTVARNLAAVVAQRLLPRANGRGRTAVNEVLLGTPQIRRMIAENAPDLTLGIEAGRDTGMQTMDNSILRSYHQGIFSYETAWTYIEDHERLGPYTENRTKSV